MAHEIVTAHLPASDGVSIRAVIPMSELSDFFGPAFHDLSEAISAGGASPAGPPFARYYAVTPEAVNLEAIMACDRPVPGLGRARPIHLEAAQAAVVRHTGRYDKLKPAYDALSEWMKENGKHPSEAPREVYVTGPDEVPNPDEWVTLVEQPMA